MFMHLFKMIWNRKRSNMWIIAEVTVAFIVAFALITLSIRSYSLLQVPLGYDYKDRWRIQVANYMDWEPERDQVIIENMLTEFTQFDQIESAHLLGNPTFRNWVRTSYYDLDEQPIHFMANTMNDGAGEAFGMTLNAGEWFGPQHEGQNYRPVMVSQRFVDEFFPGQNIIGKDINGSTDGDREPIIIVGIFEEFRQLGELSAIRPYVFHRIDLNQPSKNPISGIEIKLRPNTPVSFEETLRKQLKRIAPQWEYQITPWTKMRDQRFQQDMLPIVVLGIVGTFLLIMVAMGLFGVLWQNVTNRTREIGLRRALGATQAQIHRQVIGELVVMVLLGISIATLLLIQLPILGVFSELTWALFGQSLVVSVAFMLLLATICAYYPGKLATKHSPAMALHYE